MPVIKARADNLNEANRRFEHAPLTVPVFLNSVPKSGTHLLRNILRMFVPVEQQYHDTFIQIPILRQHVGAFDPRNPRLSWGHLLFCDDSALALQHARHILLVRDPYDWVLARARFFLSDTFQSNLEHLKGGRVRIEEMLNMMIFGIHGKAPTLQEIYTHNAVAWLGPGVKLVHFENLIRSVKTLSDPAGETSAHAFFADLLGYCGIEELPRDWIDRVMVGSDREQSGTARENLSGNIKAVPEVLPDLQKRLVNVAAPGLREVLGYF
jgi:hypothetical protein